jgi:hypothetical protein
MTSTKLLRTPTLFLLFLLAVHVDERCCLAWRGGRTLVAVRVRGHLRGDRCRRKRNRSTRRRTLHFSRTWLSNRRGRENIRIVELRRCQGRRRRRDRLGWGHGTSRACTRSEGGNLSYTGWRRWRRCRPHGFNHSRNRHPRRRLERSDDHSGRRGRWRRGHSGDGLEVL